jgi:hypothetical protein
MSEPREVDAGDAAVSPISRAEKKARLAAVLDRGYINYALDTGFVDPSKHAEWVRYDTIIIAEMKAKGFEIYHGTHPNALHSAADGTIRVGDTILMVTTKEQKELLDEILQDRINKIHGIKGTQIEEATFTKAVDGGIVPINRSTVEEVDADQIAALTKG